MSTIEEALKKAEKRRQQELADHKLEPTENFRNNDLSNQEISEDSYALNVETTQSEIHSVGEHAHDIKAELEVERFDWNYLKEHGFITADNVSTKLAEEYRVIKRPLVVNAIGARKKDIQRSNLILITSSVPGEGKTFTSVNLALSIAAEMDKKVLLIDGDVSKPGISKVLGIKRSPGLIEFLEGEIESLSDIILQTEIEGLRVIPAGKRHQYSTELLASDKMASLAQELSDRYPDRIVIFDTPPLLATSQAEVLASMVGQVVLVIAAESTPEALVMESVQKLENCAEVVMTLLNKVQRSSLDSGYYGYGNYGYGK